MVVVVEPASGGELVPVSDGEVVVSDGEVGQIEEPGSDGVLSGGEPLDDDPEFAEVS